LRTIKGIPLTPRPGDRSELPISTLGGNAGSPRDPTADTSPIDSQKLETLIDVPKKRHRRLLVPLALAVGISALMVGVTLAVFTGGSYDASAATVQAPSKKAGSGPVGAAQPIPARNVTIDPGGLPGGAGVDEGEALDVVLEPLAPGRAEGSAQADTVPKVGDRKSGGKREKKKHGWEANPFD
jgi:hypothetical protein